jgi:uncharacterized cupin superfamily protein
MSVQASFNPAYGTGITVAPTGTSASSTIGVGSKSLVLTNLSSTVVAYVRVGTGATTATTADYPVLPSTQVTISKAQDQNTVAYITASVTGSIHIMAGEGY